MPEIPERVYASAVLAAGIVMGCMMLAGGISQGLQVHIDIHQAAEETPRPPKPRKPTGDLPPVGDKAPAGSSGPM